MRIGEKYQSSAGYSMGRGDLISHSRDSCILSYYIPLIIVAGLFPVIQPVRIFIYFAIEWIRVAYKHGTAGYGLLLFIEETDYI